MWTNDEIKGKILHKLTRMGKFEHSHIPIDNLPKGFPIDQKGKVKDMVKELIKEELLLTKPTSYGLEISINLKHKEKVLEYIKTFLDKKEEN